MLRDHGQSQKYMHDIEGYNGRLDAIQAGILGAKLRHLARWNEQRREHARRYDELLADSPLVPPHVPACSRPVHHLYVIRVADRDRVKADLAAAGIETGIHYPVPLHLLKAYEAWGHRPDDFPVARWLSDRIVSLPLYAELTPAQRQCVTDSVREFYGQE